MPNVLENRMIVLVPTSVLLGYLWSAVVCSQALATKIEVVDGGSRTPSPLIGCLHRLTMFSEIDLALVSFWDKRIALQRRPFALACHSMGWLSWDRNGRL